MNVNKVFLMGRLTRDPEQRFLPSGQSVVNFGLAVNRTYRVEGERREETTFVDVEAWGPRGEVIHRYLKRGAPIFVEGRLRLDQWEGPNGEKRSRLKVVLENFQFVGGRQEDRRAPSAAGEELAPEDFGIEPDAQQEAGGEAETPF